MSRVGYHESARELTAGDVGNAAGRACVVLYQTPILHVSKNARVGVTRTHEFYVASLLLCRYFRLDVSVLDYACLSCLPLQLSSEMTRITDTI